MAGRGCTITLQVLGIADGAAESISLPVALHSPLEVLKEQLEEITGITFQNQVLILCDLTDPDRNNDILLTGRDYMSLRDCGIRNGSQLTLHPLDMPTELQRQILNSVKRKISSGNELSEKEIVHRLDTPVTAANANHSYNGIIFDVEAKGPYEIFLRSVSVGGMLGLVVSHFIVESSREYNCCHVTCHSASLLEIVRGKQTNPIDSLLHIGGLIARACREMDGR